MSEIYPIKKSWEQEAKVNKKEYDNIYKNLIIIGYVFFALNIY